MFNGVIASASASAPAATATNSNPFVDFITQPLASASYKYCRSFETGVSWPLTMRSEEEQGHGDGSHHDILLAERHGLVKGKNATYLMADAQRGCICSVVIEGW